MSTTFPSASRPLRAAPRCHLIIGRSDGDVPGPELLGSKAHNLARMARIGLRVPPAFVLDTGWCARQDALSAADWLPALQRLEQATGTRLGDPRRPLLLSVRSGAPVSMPGMMETLLDIGLNDQTVRGLIGITGNPRLAWDAYRRLVSGFGEVVLGLPAQAFETDLAAVGGEGEGERFLDFDALRRLTGLHLQTVQRLTGRRFPQDPAEQLAQAITTVFRSWQGEKARTYRHLKDIDEAIGTAVTVQQMVFGNAGGDSGAGVGFTRHPATGAPEPWVDYLFNAQGEDVVSGRRSAAGSLQLVNVAPMVWRELVETAARLEAEFRDMQDFEFTVERGQLYLLQTRPGKRTPRAAARIALDLLAAGVIDVDLARARTRTLDAATLTEAVLASGEGAIEPPLALAQSACTGIAQGEIALDAAQVTARHAVGVATVLVRQDAETDDIAALSCAEGLLTARGARTSHAAVVARQLGKVCLVGCSALDIDFPGRRVRIGERWLAEGDALTLDGHTGAIHAGAQQVLADVPTDLLERLDRLRQSDALPG